MAVVIEYKYSKGVPFERTGIRSLWDWLDLLIVPLLLGFGIFYLNKTQRQAELDISEKRAEIEQQIAFDKRQQEYLERYYARMEDLLLQQGLRESKPHSEVRTIAHTRTRDVLRAVGGERKGQVLQFLNDARLIRRAGAQDHVAAQPCLDSRRVDAPPMGAADGQHVERSACSDSGSADRRAAGSELERALARVSHLVLPWG